MSSGSTTRALAFVLLAICGGACGGSPAPSAVPASRPVVTAIDGGAGGAGARVDLLPSLETLAARGPTDAPLMREALRVEHAAPRSPDVRADRDLCVRASFAASKPVRVWFADDSGAARGDATTATSGTVPPRGPVCAKKGEALHLVVEGLADARAPEDGGSPAPAARAVIFASP